MPVFVPLLPTAKPTNFFYVLLFFHHVNNKKCSYSSDHSCLSSGSILYEALCYRVCLRFSESFLARMEISFQCIVCCAMYTCKYICHRKIVTENLLVWMRLYTYRWTMLGYENAMQVFSSVCLCRLVFPKRMSV